MESCQIDMMFCHQPYQSAEEFQQLEEHIGGIFLPTIVMDALDFTVKGLINTPKD